VYKSLHAKTGIDAAVDWAGEFPVQHLADDPPDGLTFIPPADADSRYFGAVRFPERLHAWLVDLRLLRHIPLCYLVPDETLLPVESIRFFHVDQGWTNRVIDGVFAAANTGAADLGFSYTMLSQMRESLDGDLQALARQSVPASNWMAGKHPMTGALIRSELVRRWPNMIVTAFDDTAATQPLPVLRSEPISKTISISLFAGLPASVEMREPNVGTRFGVEPKSGSKAGPPYFVHERTTPDAKPSTEYQVMLRAQRVIDIDALANKVPDTLKGKPGVPDSRMVAVQLERRPYEQVFTSGPAVPESRGWSSLVSTFPVGHQIQFSSGRTLDLSKHLARLAKAVAQET
jgi:hypothetical protein